MKISSNSADPFIDNYKPYRSLPSLAGLSSFRKATESGLSVETSVYRLKRHHYALRRLHQILVSRIASEPIYELKMAFSLHAYLIAEHISALRARVGEMREPPLGLDKVPNENLAVFFDEILCAPTTAELLFGVYGIGLPLVVEAIVRHRAETHCLADQPTRRLCRFAEIELCEIVDYGKEAIRALIAPGEHKDAAAYVDRLTDILENAGGMDGSRAASDQIGPRVYSEKGFSYDSTPQRDDRFPDPYNMGVNAEAFLYDQSKPSDAKVLMMFYKRLREIDVPEMMSSILTETEGKPWEYYHDMTRQLWDEARHAVLYFIEQGLMPKTGKRHEWEVAVMSQNKLAATFQDYDWADEVLHARIGRDWYVKDMPNAAEAVKYGDECWNKVMLDWNSWKEKGLTQHENWWPDLYRTCCEKNGVQPDTATLEYLETYESKRADLKAVVPMK